MSCKHHPGQDCSCYCRFFGCSPRNCSVGEAFEDEKPKPPSLPASGAEPEFMVVPLDGTDEEQRQALERALEAKMTAASKPAFSVSTAVTGSTVTLRTAATEPPPAARTVLVLSRSGRSVERIMGPMPGGWGYVVRSEGVAAELLVKRDEGRALRLAAGLIHERVDPAKMGDGHFEAECEHVGGPCSADGFYWALYAPIETLLGRVTEGWEAPEELWRLLESVVDRRIEYRKEKP